MAETKSSTSAERRFAFIDTIRGVSAMAVVYLHAANLLARQNIASGSLDLAVIHALTKFTDIGKVGVIMFFAVSGFVIPQTLMPAPGACRRFFVSRLFRLYPAYWLSIILAVILSIALGSGRLDISTVLVNLTMLQQFVGFPNAIPVYWTLQIELIFYALCVLLFVIGILHNKQLLFSILFLIAAVVCAIIRYETHAKIPVAIPLSLSIMFWGSLMREYRISRDESAGRRCVIMMTLYAALLPVIAFTAYDFDAGFEETWYRYVTSYYIAIMLFIFLPAPPSSLARRFPGWEELAIPCICSIR